MQNQKFGQKQLDTLRTIFDEAGIKLTHQRLEIFKELLVVNDHPSAEQIYQRIHHRLPTVAMDTVYRTLATFDELGLVKKLHVMNERTLFDINVEVHHHFICSDCKKVEDIYWPDFDKSVLPESVGVVGKAHSRHLEIHGLCNRCLEGRK
jgi:Fur family peroxide stress response transcriptional regulator